MLADIGYRFAASQTFASRHANTVGRHAQGVNAAVLASAIFCYRHMGDEIVGRDEDNFMPIHATPP